MKSCFQRTITSLKRLFRDVVLVVCVGILGSQFLLPDSGGYHGIHHAEAFVGDRENISFEYNIVLAPSNPRQVSLISVATSQSHDGLVFIQITDDDRPEISCHPTNNEGIWICPTPGLLVFELGNIQAFIR